MSTHHYHLYAIGNALVDTEYEVSDAQLLAMGVDKGHMTLIDAPRRTELLARLHGQQARRTGGGSAGNTVVALSQLGGNAFYSCRVADDELGAFYAQDLAHNGVATNLSHTRALQGQTGSCLVLVTPDAERSLCTFLGATAELEASALHPKDIVRAQVYYMEGYLAASPSGLQAALEGRRIAAEAGKALALTLSDVSMIQFCRPGLEAMAAGGLDYLFCNEEEARAWTGLQEIGAVAAAIGNMARTICITRGAQGSLVLENGLITDVPAPSIDPVDSNGAGDMFAGAFLYAATHGHSHAQAALLGNRCAAAVVSQHGNRLRPEQMRALLPA
ncbi:MAG: 2-dehydro-3-deoxygluconokinase [Pseudomonadota bacterium]|jgi:sugar/nucleoside kinase (ribokinase family)